MLAFLGLGHMGTPMARRLVAAGHDVVVWNRTHERTAPLVAAGARAADTPAAAASGADLVLTMLADPPAVETVLFGPDGVLSAIRPGACLVEMSTIGRDAVRGIAGRLPAGVGLVDAPVGGGVGQAEAGRLRMFAGGAPADLERVAPVLAELGTVVRCGGVGSGAAVKLVNNTALVAGMALLGETVRLADSLDVPRELAIDVLAAGPLGGVLQRATARGGHFTIGLAAKDLGLAMAVEPLPVASAALDTVRDLAAGHAKEELRLLAHLDDD
ncbi:MAG TPA: NAD(P)-dependent oxidoreductase [Actinophytocola sp.]|uniref:NAD(P)-dependent oxidoreductase n=1 Tax=Actinophytocola sp. TaxID=1872138 RepID=UPI002DDDB4E7|nr:NAD(P)-dependent oxidoreductase [Actinophytocola sp.]HEV2780885.1 NAD(P)-dependent oxidoreductase [Actinophytocola sp.]